ncbi:CCA tRNA nucleotidyltransferase [Paracoccus litorisediminis]|uniref:CCA tRNA nucleotidyltransferase n=1 Tax=Paracoccus litorisediminis TaxID=2006130 RepID=UPI00372E6637
MKLNAAFLQDPEFQHVMQVIEGSGRRAYVVGGAVRNALLSRPIADIDIATDARPEEVIALAAKAGLGCAPTGIAHGTVTIVSGPASFEITTFRRDVATDGRRATVAFTDRLEEDAQRRDFTMNGLYATRTGDVIDPVDGLSDLEARRLRFIGDPASRIREDYLRILRYFRFLATVASAVAPGGIEAITSEASGLDQVSGERIGAEMRKILGAPDPRRALALMHESGALDMVFPCADISALPELLRNERRYHAKADWRLRLSLISRDAQIDRLKLSGSEKSHLQLLAALPGTSLDEAAYRHGEDIARSHALLHLARNPFPLEADWPARIQRASRLKLPIRSSDLMPGLAGKELGMGLREAEAHWIASGFTAEPEDLIGVARGSRPLEDEIPTPAS